MLPWVTPRVRRAESSQNLNIMEKQHAQWQARFLRRAIAAIVAYLYAGELLPGVAKASSALLPESPSWAAQQVVLLSTLCVLTAILNFTAPPVTATAPATATAFNGETCGRISASISPGVVFAAAHLLPLALEMALVAAWPDDACSTPPCTAKNRRARAVLDAVGLYSGRLARLDLGLCLLPASKESLWMLVLSGGWRRLDYSGAMPIHRAAGSWCLAMSALHSAAFIFFYLLPGGSARGGGSVDFYGLLLSCLPLPTPGQGMNRLGLVNGFGVLGAILAAALALTALPAVRRRLYHAFQWLHLPLSLAFVACCALHDREVLLFALPGIASWYYTAVAAYHHSSGAITLRHGVLMISRIWGGSGRPRPPLRATARALLGTSGEWVELTISGDRQQLNCSSGGGLWTAATNGGRGNWLSVRAPMALGREWHPFSVAGFHQRDDGQSMVELSLVVSARKGDWSRRLAALAAATPAASYGTSVGEAKGLEVEIQGPFEAAGDWSLLDDGAGEQHLLLLAGGTGITGWLPGLQAHFASGSAVPYRLVWCVQNQDDYLALRGWLPPCDDLVGGDGTEVIIYVTRGDSDTDQEAGRRVLLPWQQPRQQQDTLANMVMDSGDRHYCGAQGPTAVSTTLLAVLAGLWIGFWGIHCLGLHTDDRDGWVGLAHYAAASRVLPLVVMLAAIVITTAVTRCLMTHLLPQRGRQPLHLEAGGEEVDRVEATSPQLPLIHHSTRCQQGYYSSGLCPELPMETMGVYGGFSANHEIRKGRPDLAALIADSATKAHQKGGFLTVVACGPTELVRAARAAAAHHDSLRIQMQCSGQPPVKFVGDEPEW